MALSGSSSKTINQLRGSVPEKLLGTIPRAKKKFRPDGVAIRLREKPTLTALYEDIKDYS